MRGVHAAAGVAALLLAGARAAWALVVLDPSWEPQALILLGYPQEAPPTRQAPSVESRRVVR